MAIYAYKGQHTVGYVERDDWGDGAPAGFIGITAAQRDAALACNGLLVDIVDGQLVFPAVPTTSAATLREITRADINVAYEQAMQIAEIDESTLLAQAQQLAEGN